MLEPALRNKIIRRDKRDFTNHYTSTKRTQEILCILAYVLMCGAMLYKGWVYFRAEHLFLILSSFFLSAIAADFVSGFVHWMADTWGRMETPLVGRTLVRSFREHHVYPTALTEHDWVEANGDNCMIVLPAPTAALLLPLEYGYSTLYFLYAFIFFFSIWIVFTNQIHKWSHMKEVGPVVRFFQKTALILSPEHHSIHHTPPFDRYHCITNGWLNPVLSGLRFFWVLEKSVYHLTGAIPRFDDLGPEVAIQLAHRDGIIPERHFDSLLRKYAAQQSHALEPENTPQKSALL